MHTTWLFPVTLIFGLTTPTTSKKVCETGWIPYGDHCYKFSNTSTTFKDAVTRCYGMNSNLVEPNAAAEENWMLVQGVVRGIRRLWIGVTDLLQNQTFVYISNGNDVQEAYNNWDKGQPDPDDTEHCVALPAGYKGWHDYPCDSMFNFVCTRGKN